MCVWREVLISGVRVSVCVCVCRCVCAYVCVCGEGFGLSDSWSHCVTALGDHRVPRDNSLSGLRLSAIIEYPGTILFQVYGSQCS